MNYETSSKVHLLQNLAERDGASRGNFQQKIVRVLKKMYRERSFVIQSRVVSLATMVFVYYNVT